MAQLNGQGGLTLTVLGCGTMGIAILSGVMAALKELQAGTNSQESYPQSTVGTPTDEYPPLLPSRFIGCVRRQQSAKRIRSSLAHYDGLQLEAVVNANLKAVQEADIVILGCKPQMFREILAAPGIKDALAGKLLITILAGVTAEQIETALYGEDSSGDNLPQGACRVVRAMPNTASFVRESMTVISTCNPPLSPHFQTLTTWIFSRIGRVVILPPTSMDASTALCGSGPAFMALVLEAMADGGVAMGLPRAEAQLMAAQTMRGTTGLVLNGEHPAVLRDKVSTPGGCTIGGLLVLEEGTVRGSMARAVREATVVAAQLGRGVVGVNGTRFVEGKQ